MEGPLGQGLGALTTWAVGLSPGQLALGEARLQNGGLGRCGGAVC